MKESLETIAYENGLNLINTTSESNGYPRDIKSAIIGLSTYEEAYNLSKKHNLEIQEFRRKDGWDLWYRTGNPAYEPYDGEESYNGDDYTAYPKVSEKRFIEIQGIADAMADKRSLDEMSELLDREKEIYDEIESMGDDQLVITYCGHYYKTIDKHSMCFYYDQESYVIGLIEKDE